MIQSIILTNFIGRKAMVADGKPWTLAVKQLSDNQS